MTSKTNKIRNAREANRKFKKKANPLAIEKVVFIDYKDVSLLQRFMSDRSKIRGMRMSGANVQQQRDLATAIKNAREMALLPYTKRTVSTRAPRPGKEGREDESSLEMPDQSISSSFVPEGGEEAAAVDAVETAAEATEVVDAEVEA
ncbi:MAG: ribosomal protein [Actinomycetota bacterium]|jgi:small subunit ribosomal protein S18